MVSKSVLLFFLGILISNLFGYGSLRIANVRDSWKSWEGEIDTLVYEIEEQHLFCRVWVEMTIRDPNPQNLTDSDSLEIQLGFELPENSAVDSLYLWVDGKPEAGHLLAGSTAREIYEGIVKRRADPALLTTWGGNYYSLKIFPVMPGQSRKVRIGFHCPINPRDKAARLKLPLDFLSGSSYDYENRKYVYFNKTVKYFAMDVKTSGFFKQSPKLEYPTQSPFFNTTQNRYFLIGQKIQFDQNSVRLNFGDWPDGAELINAYSEDQDRMGYFSMILDPFKLLGLSKRLPVSLSVAWTPSLNTYSDAAFKGEREAIRTLLTETLEPNDKFNLHFAGADIKSFSKTLTPVSDLSQSQMTGFINQLPGINYPNYYSRYERDSTGRSVYIPPPPPPGRDWAGALVGAFQSFQVTDKQPVVLVVDRGYSYRYYKIKPTISRLDSTVSQLAFKNKYGALMVVISSYSRLALYKSVVEKFGGRVIRGYAYGDMTGQLNELTPDIFSVPLTSITIQVNAQNGYPALEVFGVPKSRIPWNNKIFLSGRVPGTSSLKLTIAGESNGKYLHNQKSVSLSKVSQDSPEKFWAVKKINEAPYYSIYGYYGGATEDMTAFSLKHKVLTRYTALLALEPGMDSLLPGNQGQSTVSSTSRASDGIAFEASISSNSPSLGGGGSNDPDIIGIKHLEKAGIDFLEVSPNPFTRQLKIQLSFKKLLKKPLVIRVFGIDGKLVYEIKRKITRTGLIQFLWNGKNNRGQSLPKGMYLVQFQIGKHRFMRKVALI